jgi:PAS domain S-box-containing protein
MKSQLRTKLRTPTRVVCLVAIYFLAGFLGKHATFMSGDVALVWPHAGIALAAVLLFGYRFLPGVAIGAFLFSVMDGKPLGFFTFGTALGNCVGATICAYLLQKSVGFQSRMERARDAVSFIALAALFGTTINALFNVASVYAGGQTDWDNLGSAFLVWWIPNAMGCLVIAPLLLSWSHFQIPRWSAKRAAELTVCAFGLIAATVFSFESWYTQGITQYPLAFLPYPFVVWAALRFGVRGATLSTLVVATASIHAVLGKRGPFVLDSEVQTLLLVGSYIAVVAIANLLLAASAAERAASERRYRAVVEDQTESICRFDRQGNLTFVNDAFCRSRGKSRDELMGTSFLPQVSALDLEIPLTTFLQLAPEDPVLSYDARVSTAQGLGWEQCSVRALYDRDDVINEFQLVSQDITKRKNVEEALRASEEKLKAILADGILTLDEECSIVSCNPAAERIFGLRTAELTARPFGDLFIQGDSGTWIDAIQTVESKGVVELELRGKRRAREAFPVHLCICGLPVNGRAGYVVVARDISGPKQVEEQLRHSQKMETVGHLAGGVAHDFHNLLSIIVGHASLMIAVHKVSGKVAHGAQQILKAAERGSRLTRQLLMFSRKEVMQTKLLNLNDSVMELSKMLQRVLGENIVMEVRPSAEPLPLQADEGMLDQVLMNLAVNARDAMPEGGRLVIATGRRELSERDLDNSFETKPGCFAVMSITDNGSGIPPEILPRIYEPFFTTKEVGKGTGLGLSTVYGIVKQHRGMIQVQSEMGRGTTFEIFLPLQLVRESRSDIVLQSALAAA